MNFTALDNAPSKQTVRAYINAHPEQKPYVHMSGEYASNKKTRRSFIYSVAMLPISLLIGTLIGIAGLQTRGEGNTGSTLLLSAIVILILCIVIVVAVISLGTSLRWNAWRVAAQLDLFARDNGFRHIRDLEVHPEGLLSLGSASATYLKTNAIVTSEYEVGSIFAYDYKDNRSSRTFGYIRVPLATDMPNMILAAKTKTTFPNLLGDTSSSFTQNDKVALEGDFDKYFTLVVPKGGQEMARYFFTPDLMALFIDNDQGHDVEVIDNSLYIYVTVDWFDHGFWENAQRIYDTIGAKMESEVELYKNAAATEAALAKTNGGYSVQPGSRLVRKTPVIVIILSIVVILFYCLRFYFDIYGTK